MLINDLIQTLDGITSATDEQQLALLDETLIKLATHPQKELAFQALFQLFERFPDQDGFGVFWSILHFLEGVSGYDTELLRSIERQPSEFTLLMINRLLNVRTEAIGNQDLLTLLKKIMTDANQTPEIRRQAAHFVEYQQRHT